MLARLFPLETILNLQFISVCSPVIENDMKIFQNCVYKFNVFSLQKTPHSLGKPACFPILQILIQRFIDNCCHNLENGKRKIVLFETLKLEESI